MPHSSTPGLSRVVSLPAPLIACAALLTAHKPRRNRKAGSPNNAGAHFSCADCTTIIPRGLGKESVQIEGAPHLLCRSLV